MANTAVSICSNALVKLGDDAITALTDATNRARHCNRLFDPTRQAVLRDTVWNDSIKRVKLAQLVAAPVWEFGYQYSLPGDFIRKVKFDLDDLDLPYKIEGAVVVTDAAEVYLKYIYDNEDVASYDSLHVDALTARMAYELANAITAKQSLAQTMWAEYEAKLKSARAVDGAEDYPDEHIAAVLVDFRQ